MLDAAAAFFLCAEHVRQLGGVSSFHNLMGEVIANRKGIAVRRGLKEAWRQTYEPKYKNRIRGIRCRRIGK